MAETFALCFSLSSTVSRTSYSSLLASPPSSPLRRFSFLGLHSSSRNTSIFMTPKASSDSSGNFLGDDAFGFYPWDSLDLGDGAIKWVPEERVTLFTADGLVQIGGSMVPRRVSSSDKKHGKSKTSQSSLRFKESDYMDPEQGLCLGALFDIAATNGLDMGRRLCIIGFCRSIEMLSDVVEDTVLEHGGEVVAAEKATKGGLHEKLTMTVAVPLLWGVPPASERLRLAVRSGGGIVEKVDHYGLVPSSSPRQADVILIAGTVTMKMAPLVRLYEQMPEPKYVIAMGACTITRGMFSADSCSTVRGVDKLIPVDVYLPGCPPKPEAVIDAITKLRKKISREKD